jgi:hypothetical protein
MVSNAGRCNMTSRTLSTVLVVVLVFGAAGCGDDVEQIPADETRRPADEEVKTVDTPPAVAAKRLLFKVPPGWTRVEPQGTFRYAQVTLPLAEGDQGEATLVVYWHIGGGVEANVRRWLSEFTDADGKPVAREKAKVKPRLINGLNVTTVDVSGNYGSSMGGGPHAAGTIENARMLGAVVEVPGGEPYFIKAVGPAKTMAAVASDFEVFLDSLGVK